jgi:hypothetical protein
MYLPSSFTTVTRFSKLLALVLFVTLPFASFLLGARYQKSIYYCPSSEVDVVPKAQPTNPITAKTTSSASIIVPLTFGENTSRLVISLEQTAALSDTNNFLSFPIKSFDSKVSSITGLYNEMGDWSKFLFYDTNADKYISLEPGGRIEIGLTTEKDIQKILGPAITRNSVGSDTMTKTSCTRRLQNIGNIEASAVTCKVSSYLISDNNRLVDESETTDCYLPVSPNQYMAIKQVQKPISTNVDICQIIEALGYQNLAVSQN